MWRRNRPSLNVTFTTFVILVFAIPTVRYTDSVRERLHRPHVDREEDTRVNDPT